MRIDTDYGHSLTYQASGTTVRIRSQGEHIGDGMEYAERIIRDPGVCGREPVIKGTRVTVRTILASLAEGAETAEIVADFPTLTAHDVRAVIAFAAISAEEDLPIPGIPSVA